MAPRKNSSYGATAASVMSNNFNVEAPRNLDGATPNRLNAFVNNVEAQPKGSNSNKNNANTVITIVPNSGASTPRINKNNSNRNNANTVMTFTPNNGATVPRRNTNKNNSNTTFVGGRRRKNRSRRSNRKSKKTRKQRR